MTTDAKPGDAGPEDTGPERVATGTEGLDAVLDSGLLRHGLHLVRGGPGTGKTTLGLQFLLRGSARAKRSST